MDLNPEDDLRLNVLLANKPQAIRIDESAMVVHGLTAQGDVKVTLNPSGRNDRYVKKVRELLSGHFLGSPGGYPVFLRRWTRMGQMRNESLEQLLLLGEPEAVVAAVSSPGLTDELARRAWWAMEDPANARHMLANEAVVGGEMGSVLARYLIDYLPFETETEHIMHSVRLVLQPGLLDGDEVRNLWRKSARKQAYLVGFLATLPDDLPEPVAPRRDADEAGTALGGLAEGGDPVAALMLKLFQATGQTYLNTVQTVLRKPPTQDVVVVTLELLRRYFGPLRPEGDPDLPMEALLEEAQAYCEGQCPPEVQNCLNAAPQWRGELQAMRVLSGLGYGVLRPVLRDSTAIGSLMRRKLEPVLGPVLEKIGVLRGQGS